MDTTKCISNSQWEAYSKGLLTAQELRSVQSHAAVCELCADIKEGIDLMAKPAQLSEKVAQIQQQIDGRIKPKRGRMIGIIAFVAAAAVVVAIANGFLFMAQEDAEQQVVYQPSLPATKDSVQTDTSSKKMLALELPKPQKSKTPPITKQATLPIPEQVPANSNAAMTEDVAEPLMVDDASESKIAKVESDAVLEQKTAPANEQVKALSQTTETLAKPKAKTSYKQKNIYPAPANVSQNNQNNLYLNNIEVLPVSDSSQVSKARVLVAQKQFTASLSLVIPIANDSTSAYYHEALFLTAQSFTGLNQNEAAAKYLKEILKSKNAFEDRAKSLLERLQKD
jgi:hypothetical protein